MQVLKDEVRESIEISARQLFLEKGYEKSSMKEIAVNAGISKSNLYNYFKSKEEIFDALTKSVRNQIEKFLTLFLAHEFDEPFGSQNFIDMLSDNIFNYLLSQKDEFLLLMNGSKGTRHEHVKRDVIKKLEAHFKSELNTQLMSDQSNIMEVIAQNLLEGLVRITFLHTDEERIREDVKWLVTYHVNGIRSFF